MLDRPKIAIITIFNQPIDDFLIHYSSFRRFGDIHFYLYNTGKEYWPRQDNMTIYDIRPNFTAWWHTIFCNSVPT